MCGAVFFNTETGTFGTTKISPLYRYAPNTKDLSDAEKSFVANPTRPERDSFYDDLIVLDDRLKKFSELSDV